MEKAGLGKRILSIVYDFLILFFIIIVSTFIIQQLIIQLELTTLEQVQISKDETIAMIPADSIVTLILKNIWVAISFFYFGHYWTKRGQTLGMRVWKIKAATNGGELMSWGSALKRYVFALLGLGFLWMIVDKENLPLQDRLSKTKLTKII
jgi:uncharacterized RDD family membrane protein YckC